jgi:hypothetical protein
MDKQKHVFNTVSFCLMHVYNQCYCEPIVCMIILPRTRQSLTLFTEITLKSATNSGVLKKGAGITLKTGDVL